MERTITKQVTGYATTDGAGVHLVRVLGHKTTGDYDPFLMLDSFDSDNPDDYTAGFPMHPHRGIETISYLAAGAMTHRDSMGNEDTITSGEVQWMTAGSGIMHEEMLPAVDRMLGVQLWLNLPKEHKMAAPNYHALKKETIQIIPLEGGTLRLLAGRYGTHEGFRSRYQPLDYYAINLEAGATIRLPVDAQKAAFVFTLKGDAEVGGTRISEKTAALTGEGTTLVIKALDEPIEILFISSERLNEPIAWGGPLVMNTQEELQHAFAELRNGTFLKERVDYSEN